MSNVSDEQMQRAIEAGGYEIGTGRPGRPTLTPRGEYESLKVRFRAYTEPVAGRPGCRRLKRGKSALRRKNGGSIGMQRIGWLLAQSDLDVVPDWLPTARWAKECETNACCAGEHIFIERSNSQPRRPVLPPDAIVSS